MKKFLYPLILVLALAGCQEDKQPTDQASKPDLASEQAPANQAPTDQASKQDPQISQEDIFYFPFWYMVKIDGGELVNIGGSSQIDDEKTQFWDINFADDYFIGRNTDDTAYGIYKIEGKEVKDLYSFPDDEKFFPIGMAGDYIYGFHSIQGDIDQEDQFIGAYNVKSGDFADFTNIKQRSFGSAVVTDDRLIYQDIVADDREVTTREYTLKLDGNFDQEPIAASQYNFISDMYAIRFMEEGDYFYQVLRTNDEGIVAGDMTWPIPAEVEGKIKPFGKYMLRYAKSTSEDAYEFEQNLKIYQAFTGELLHDINIRGQRFVENTLYYISTDNEIESIDLN